MQYRRLFNGRVTGLTTVEAALTAGAVVVPVGDISGLGDLAVEDTVDLGSGLIRDSGGTPIGDSAVLNSAITVGDIPTLTLVKISDAGALAAKATIDSAALLGAGVVETSKMAANAVTNTATGDGTIVHSTETAIVNEEEMARATITGLLSGAPVLIDVISVFSEPLGRKSTRLNSSHRCISYAVFCLKKKKDE